MKIIKAVLKSLIREFYCIRNNSKIESNYIPIKVIANNIGHGCYLGKNVVCVDDRFIMGDYSYMNSGFVGNVSVGKFCSISDNVNLAPGQHYTNKLSTYPIRRKIINDYNSPQFPENNKLSIGNDVWIGYGAVIMDGLTIGDGAIVASNAVVCKDVPPYAIVGGVPAEIIKYRFSSHIIEELLNMQWWNWTLNSIRENIDLFEEDIDEQWLKNEK